MYVSFAGIRIIYIMKKLSKMRKPELVLLIVLLLIGSIWLGVSRHVKTDFIQPKIIVSGYVPYTILKQLAEDKVEVLMLTPPNAEPHSFEPTPGALVALQEARVFVYVSEKLEPWAPDLAAAVGPKTQVVVLADVLPKGSDPHVWMRLSRVWALAFQLQGVLSDINPFYRQVFENNYNRFVNDVEELDRRFQKTLSSCKKKEVVHIGHLAFKNLLQPYGIKLTSLSGSSHEGEHSAKKLAELVKLIKEKQISVIFTEESISPLLAQTVARETGAEILPLYSIEHVSKTDFKNNATYAELMQRNLENLAKGLECQAY